MKCAVCQHGETQPGTTTLTFERDTMTLVVKRVPARVCPNCGEAYVDEDIAALVLDTAERAAQDGVQVEIKEFQGTPV